MSAVIDYCLNSNKTSYLNRSLWEHSTSDLSYTEKASVPNLVRQWTQVLPYQQPADQSALSGQQVNFLLPQSALLDDIILQVNFTVVNSNNGVALSLERGLLLVDQIVIQGERNILTINGEYIYSRVQTSAMNEKLRYLTGACGWSSNNYQQFPANTLAAGSAYNVFIPLFFGSFEKLSSALDTNYCEKLKVIITFSNYPCLINDSGFTSTLAYNNSTTAGNANTGPTCLWMNTHIYDSVSLGVIRSKNFGANSALSMLYYDTWRETSVPSSSYTEYSLLNQMNFPVTRQFLLAKSTNGIYTVTADAPSGILEPIGYRFLVNGSTFTPTVSLVNGITTFPKCIMNYFAKKGAYNDLCPPTAYANTTAGTWNFNTLIGNTAHSGQFTRTGPTTAMNFISGADGAMTIEVPKLLDVQWCSDPLDRTYNSGGLSFSQLSQPVHYVTFASQISNQYTMYCISEYWLVLSISSGTGQIIRSEQF